MKKEVVRLIVAIIVICVLSIFVYPDPNKEYAGLFFGWFTGCYHGSTIVPNYIISLFDKTRHIKAVSYSGWYNFNWWFWSIVNTYTLFIKPIFSLFSKKEAE
jgi:hypothetical protein